MAGLWDDFDTTAVAPAAQNKQAASGLWDDFDHPPAPVEKAAPPAPPSRSTGLGDLLSAGAGGIGSGLVGMGRDLVSMPLGGLAVLADRGASLFTDKPTTALEDAVFRNLVDPSYAMQAQLAPAAEAGKTEQVVHQVGSFLPDLAAMMATGGETAAPRVLTRVPDIIEQALLHATRASALPAVEHGVDTTQQVQQATGDTGKALTAGATEALSTPIANVLPLNVPGGLLSRLAQGAVTGVAGERLQNALVNPTLPAELQRPEDDSTAGIIGALMAGALGARGGAAAHAQAPRPVAEPGRAEPPMGDAGLRPEDTRDLDAMLAEVNARAQRQAPAPETSQSATETSQSEPPPPPAPAPAPPVRAAQPDALANAKRAFDDTVKEAVAAGADPRAYAAHVAARFGVSADAILHTPDTAPAARQNAAVEAAPAPTAEPAPTDPQVQDDVSRSMARIDAGQPLLNPRDGFRIQATGADAYSITPMGDGTLPARRGVPRAEVERFLADHYAERTAVPESAAVEPQPARAPEPASADAEQPVFSRARAEAPDTPAFRRFFDGSQVVDDAGRPLPVYHGTAEDFHVFSGDRSGDATGHSTSPLGHFFTPDRAQAERYAQNASDGRPADERVVDAYLAVRKPYTMPLREAQAIESPEQARQVRARLEAEGYDGIRIPEANTWVAFRSEQIKSASENRGTFDPGNPDIRFSQSPIKSVEANIRRGRDAMARAITDKADQHRAMFRTGMGWVDFVWGDSAKGLQHIIERRSAEGEDAQRMLVDEMVDTIASGSEIRRSEVGKSVRVVLHEGNHEAVLVRRAGSNSWLLTGFRELPGGEGRSATPSSPTHAEPIRSRLDVGAGVDASEARSGLRLPGDAQEATPKSVPPGERAGNERAAGHGAADGGRDAETSLGAQGAPGPGATRAPRATLQIDVRPPRTVAPEHLNRVRNVANDVASGLRNAPRIEVLASPDELPPGLRERVRSDPAEAGMPDGMFVPGRNTVYLFAGAIPDARRAAWVVMHEVAGHYGLRGLLGNELAPALRRAGRNDTVAQLAEAIKRDRGEPDMDPLRATEEALAELAAALRTGDFEGIAQRYGVEVPDGMRTGVRSTVQRFVEAMRELLRRVTGRAGRFTDADVHRLLEDAWRYVRDGNAEPTPRRAAEAPMRATETAAGERTIARGEDRFVQRGGDYYLAGAAGEPRDFASVDEAQAAAERAGGEVRQDEPVEGQPRTWSVVLPEGQVAAGERQLMSRATRGEAEARAEGRRDELRQMLGGPTQGGAIGWDFDATRWEGTQGMLRAARAHLQDKMIAWRDVQQDIVAALGHAIPDAQNVYRMENLMHGRVKEGIDRLEHDTIAPLIKAMRDADVKPDTLERYLYARHAKERNAEIAKINPDMPDGGSGMTNAEADAALQELAPQRGKLDALAARVDALVKQTRRSLLEHGLITREQFDAMEAQYQHYVPLRGRNAERPDFGSHGPGAGRGIDTRPAPVKNALGRGAGNRATNLLGNVIGDAQRAIILGEKARVGRTVLRLALANPNPRLWRVEPVQTERRLNAAGEVYEAVVNDWSDPSIVAVRHAGKLYKVQFENPDLAQALSLVGVDQLDAISRAVGRVNRYFSAVLTRYNPAFIPVNATRDMIFGLTGMAVDHGEAAAMRTLANYPKALRAAAREARRAQVKSDADRYAREFAEDGGKTGYVSMPSVEEIQRTIGAGKLNRYDPRGLAKVAHLVADMTGIANDAVENGMRLAAYITLRERGMAREQAAQYAKDFTINFNRKGYDGSKINAWFLFFNASMQGAHRFAQVMKKPKTWAYVGSLAAAQALAAMYAMGQQDEDGTSLWDKVPEHVKQRNLVFTWRNDADEQHLLTVPMPYGFNLFTYMAGRGTQAVTDSLDGRDRPQDHAAAMTADLLSSAVQAFSPIPLDDGALGLVPTVARIPIAIQTNRNDFGRKIHRDGDNSKFDVPRASLGRPDTLELFKVAARGLNRIGGGDDYTPPPMSAFDVAPEDIQYLVQELSGGLGKFVLDSATFAQKAADPEAAITARDVPIGSKFYSTVDEQAAARSMFYERADTIERDKARVIDTYKAEGPEAAAALLKSMPTLQGATFKRYKRGDPARGHFAGDIIEDDGRPELVARDEDSMFGLYQKATKTTRAQGQEVRRAYTEAPPGLLPNAERNRAIREAEGKRYDVQRAFNAAWNRAVVPDGE